jgi:hypothetical protein
MFKPRAVRMIDRRDRKELVLPTASSASPQNSSNDGAHQRNMQHEDISAVDKVAGDTR